MYSIVLLAALTAGEKSPDWLFGCACGDGYGWGARNPWAGSHPNYYYGCTGWGGTSHAAGACYGACYGLCYGGWGGGWGLPWSGYGPGYPGNSFTNYGPGLHGPGDPGHHGPGWPGYACFGGCGGYASPAYGVPGPMVGSPVPGTPDSSTPLPEDKKNGEEKKGAGEVSIDRAKVIFNLPSDAKLYVDDKQITDAAAKRTFQTPALEKGQYYYYELRAEVTRDGKPVSETRRVIVKAGAVINADFGSLGETAGVAAAGK